MGAVATLWHRGSGWRNVTIAAVFLTALALIYPPRLNFGPQPGAAPRIPASTYTPAPSAAGSTHVVPRARFQAVPAAPSSGPRYGQIYSDTITIGGRTIPLPSSNWMVETTMPNLLRNSLVHEIVLVNIAGVELGGIIKIFANEPSKPVNYDYRGEKACLSSLNLFTSRRTDADSGRFDCAILTAENTAGWMQAVVSPVSRGALGDLAQRGVKVPVILLRAKFLLATKDQLLTAEYYLNPELDHASVPDSLAGKLSSWGRYEIARHPPLLAYAARAKTWMLRWGEVLDQGFTGKLRADTSPAPWAGLGFPVAVGGFFRPGEVDGKDPPALPQVPAGPLYDHTYSAVVPFGDRRLPLPAGTWTAVARFAGTAPWLEDAALVQTANGKVAGLVIITGNGASEQSLIDYRSQANCDQADHDYYFARAQETADGPERECVSAGFAMPFAATATGFSATFPAIYAVFPAIYNELKARAIAIPDVLVWARFHIATQHQVLSVVYYFNPEIEGIQSAVVTAQETSEWNKVGLAGDPRRFAYVDRIRAWADGWQPVLRAGFAAGFVDQSRPVDPPSRLVKAWP